VSIRVSLSWLWLLVAIQIAIPASYYLVRDDREDERFAWRMFSAVRLQRCEVDAFEGAALEPASGLREIDLRRALHASWQRALERGRRSVIEQFLELRCRSGQPAVALLERRCVAPSGRKLATESFRYDCAGARLEVLP